jgi:hypothetical protein
VRAERRGMGKPRPQRLLGPEVRRQPGFIRARGARAGSPAPWASGQADCRPP